MSQDTRKDPRAKVLTMTVRYKSATLDEFIEHHSYDVSRGGMFIKTPSPFPPGTLLKFEVKIAADQKVIQGVGRVVWKREHETTADARPAGGGGVCVGPPPPPPPPHGPQAWASSSSRSTMRRAR
jgi:uncharacterized protein (TIGR02266 family)